MINSENLKLFGNALECAHLPVMITDSNGIITHINNSMRTLFGNIEGHPRSYLFASEAGAHKEMSDPFEKMIDEDSLGESHCEAVIADVLYSVVCQNIKAEDGIPFTIMYLEDITVRKNLEKGIEENLKAIQRETLIAKNIQKSILPFNGKYWGCINLNSIYLPASDLGGDVYDIIRLNNGEILLYIADVSGHGIQASLLTIYIRENIRSAAKTAQKSMNAMMKKLITRFDSLSIDNSMYIGLLICKYSPETNELTILNAGHNCYPLIIRQNNRVEELPIRGMPLSRLSSDNIYDEESIGLYAGDRLILFTDGLIDEQNGSENIRHAAEEFCHLSSDELAEKMVESSVSTVSGTAKDDRTLVIADVL